MCIINICFKEILTAIKIHFIWIDTQSLMLNTQWQSKDKNIQITFRDNSRQSAININIHKNSIPMVLMVIQYDKLFLLNNEHTYD